MDNETIRDASCAEPAGRLRARPPRPADARTGRDTEDRSGRPAQTTHPFRSIICAGERTAIDDAARHQAALLASPRGMVDLCSASQLTRHGRRSLHQTCAGYDLLALGAGAGAVTVAENAPIPILIARLAPEAMQVTDTIVVAVDSSPGSSRAAELAGLLAAEHGATVTILAAFPPDPAFERAIAASFRVLLHATGTAPRVIGEPDPPERAIPDAAATLTASLVMLGCGRSASDRRMTALISSRIGCSVLVVPEAEPTRI
jgi:nucleotide-binding universal stress UspA family protein